MTLKAPLASCLCLSSGLIYPSFLSLAPSFPLVFFFFFRDINLCVGSWAPEQTHGRAVFAEGPHGSVVQDHTHTLIFILPAHM